MTKTLWRSRWIPAGLTAVALASLVGGVPSCARHGGQAAKLDFVLDDMNGHEVQLASYKGRPILLDFWATWCGPCKTEIPWFIEFADQYKSQNLAVLGVSVDDAPEDIRAFASARKVNYPLLVGEPHRDLRVAYEAMDVIPVSWLIRRDGTVLAKAEGMHPKEWFQANLDALVK
jgi:cytochrome c biogenesis protein CcmG/thiol:disulfide interchange protein DsbE